jgi:hypothetical protein
MGSRLRFATRRIGKSVGAFQGAIITGNTTKLQQFLEFDQSISKAAIAKLEQLKTCRAGLLDRHRQVESAPRSKRWKPDMSAPIEGFLQRAGRVPELRGGDTDGCSS